MLLSGNHVYGDRLTNTKFGQVHMQANDHDEWPSAVYACSNTRTSALMLSRYIYVPLIAIACH